MHPFEPPARSFYQSHDYVACLIAAGIECYTLGDQAELVVAARMLDGGIEVWEGPQSAEELARVWTWLIDRAREAGARYARLVLPIGVPHPPSANGLLPAASTADTLLLATDAPAEEVFLGSFLRKARIARREGLQVVEAAFDGSRFAATYLPLAHERGFIGEVDAVDVLRGAAARGRITVLHAVSDTGELVGDTVLMIHEKRLEIRYPWRSPTAGQGTMNLLVLEAWERARTRGISFLDLGGIPSQPTPSLEGVRRFKESTGGLRYTRGAFMAELGTAGVAVTRRSGAPGSGR